MQKCEMTRWFSPGLSSPNQQSATDCWGEGWDGTDCGLELHETHGTCYRAEQGKGETRLGWGKRGSPPGKQLGVTTGRPLARWRADTEPN